MAKTKSRTKPKKDVHEGCITIDEKREKRKDRRSNFIISCVLIIVSAAVGIIQTLVVYAVVNGISIAQIFGF